MKKPPTQIFASAASLLLKLIFIFGVSEVFQDHAQAFLNYVKSGNKRDIWLDQFKKPQNLFKKFVYNIVYCRAVFYVRSARSEA